MPLPRDRYEIYRLETRKVDRLGHVTFLNNYYSVPYSLVGRQLQLKSNGCLLKIYEAHEEVAVHHLAQGKGQYITREEHKPPHKQNRGRAYYAERLQHIGPAAAELMDAFIQHDAGHWKEKVQGILQLSGHFPPEVLEQACRQAMDHHLYSYQAVKSICQRLQQPDPIRLRSIAFPRTWGDIITTWPDMINSFTLQTPSPHEYAGRQIEIPAP